MRLSELFRYGVLAAALAGCADGDAPRPRAGDRFPPVSLASLRDGSPVSLESFRGKAVVLNFWATWCEPCRREMPGLERLSRESDPQALAVVGVTVDTDANLAREFVRKYAITFPNLIDPAMEAARDSLVIRTFPETFVIAADGRLAARVTGARDWGGAEGRSIVKQALGSGWPGAP